MTDWEDGGKRSHSAPRMTKHRKQEAAKRRDAHIDEGGDRGKWESWGWDLNIGIVSVGVSTHICLYF